MGANRSLLNLLLEARSRFQVEPFVVVPREGDFSQSLKDNSISHLITEVPHFATKHANESLGQRVTKSIKSWTGLRKSNAQFRVNPATKTWLGGHSISIVHSNSSVIIEGFAAASALGLPHVWHIREFADLDYGLQFPGGLASIQKLMGRSYKTICISNSVCQHFGYPANSVVIGNGVAYVEEMKQAYSTRCSWSHHKLRLGIAGLLTQSKAQDVALRLLKSLKGLNYNVELLIAGEGPAFETLKRMSLELGLGGSAKFLGKVPRPLEFFSNVHIALTCSQMEAWGRVTAEAMSAGCVVLARNTGGSLELISDGNTGYLWNDEDQLLQLATKSLDDQMLSARIGQAAHDEAVRSFGIVDYADKVVDVWKGALS